MGNDVICKDVGIGTVWIWMHDGAMCTLTDVIHVPKLKKNFISLRILNDIRCKSTAKSVVLKISRGNMTVMKGKKVNTFYHL